MYQEQKNGERLVGFLGYPYDMTGEFIRIKNVVSNNKIALINLLTYYFNGKIF